MSDLGLLRRLGDQLLPPLNSLGDIAPRRDRRSAGAVALVAAAAVAVAGTLVGVQLLTPGDGDREPRPAELPTQSAPTSPLTYADGSTIHYSGRSVGADGRVDGLDLTDEGVAHRTADGRSWFTDGDPTDTIGSLGEPVEPAADLESWIMQSDFTGARSTGRIVSENSGALLPWFAFTEPVEPEVVVYDTDAHTVALRTGADHGFELYEIVVGPGHQFDVHHGRLRPTGMQPIEVRDGATGDRLELRAPDGYPDTNPLRLVHWLADDGTVIFDPVVDQDQLLVCPVPKRTCGIAVTGSSSMVVPDAWWQ